MQYSLQFSKTRIAPTPSGFLHLGNIFSFAVTLALAKKTGASILLRIDDLDKERVQKEYVQDIFDTLNFLGIHWNEGPENCEQYEKGFSQLHRLPLYDKAFQQLKETGLLFGCDCSRSMLLQNDTVGYPGTCRGKNIPLNSENINWRLRTDDKSIAVKNINGDESVVVLPATMQDFIVRKKNGYPAYQLASVCDDDYFGVDLVVRGADLWDSTLAQLYLSSCIPDSNFGNSSFFHHPLLMEKENLKLSKSAGAVSVQFLRQQGRTPSEIFALIAAQLGIKENVHDWQSLADKSSLAGCIPPVC